MSIHVDDVLHISQLPIECIEDCSQSGDVGSAVFKWRCDLDFTVDREAAIECLSGYGAWDREDLVEEDDEDLAETVLWIACCEFRDWLRHALEAGIDPRHPPISFDPPTGSSVFTLE